MSGTRARIGGVEFDGGASYYGFTLDDTTIRGWDDAPGVRRNSIDRAGAHGSFDLPGFRDARLITLSGKCWTKTPEDQQWHRNRLMGILADGGKGRLTVDHQGTTLWSDVRLADDPSFTIGLYGLMAEYAISFWAPDPRKFGDTHEFASIHQVPVDVFHYGNFPATPKIFLTGSAASYIVDGGGRHFEVSYDLVPGHEHQIDLATGRLLIDGLVTTGGVVEANLWDIPGGTKVPHTVFVPTGGNAQMRIPTTDTYM